MFFRGGSEPLATAFVCVLCVCTVNLYVMQRTEKPQKRGQKAVSLFYVFDDCEILMATALW